MVLKVDDCSELKARLRQTFSTILLFFFSFEKRVSIFFFTKSNFKAEERENEFFENMNLMQRRRRSSSKFAIFNAGCTLPGKSSH